MNLCTGFFRGSMKSRTGIAPSSFPVRATRSKGEEIREC